MGRGFWPYNTRWGNPPFSRVGRLRHVISVEIRSVSSKRFFVLEPGPPLGTKGRDAHGPPQWGRPTVRVTYIARNAPPPSPEGTWCPRVGCHRTPQQGPFETNDKRVLEHLSQPLTEIASLSTAVGRIALSSATNALTAVRQPAIDWTQIRPSRLCLTRTSGDGGAPL
jgi:hypothetical protein